MLHWQWFTTHESSTFPSVAVTKRAVDTLGLDSPLCKYLFRCYMVYSTKKQSVMQGDFAALPHEFLSRVLEDSCNTNRVWSLEELDWCEYHNHKDEQERQLCERKWSDTEDDEDGEDDKEESPRYFVA